MTNYIDKLLISIFISLGKRYFGIVVTYAPDVDGDLHCIHFARDERALNTSIRSYLEDLDASYDR